MKTKHVSVRCFYNTFCFAALICVGFALLFTGNAQAQGAFGDMGGFDDMAAPNPGDTMGRVDGMLIFPEDGPMSREEFESLPDEDKMNYIDEYCEGSEPTSGFRSLVDSQLDFPGRLCRRLIFRADSEICVFY